MCVKDTFLSHLDAFLQVNSHKMVFVWKRETKVELVDERHMRVNT